MEVIHQMNLDGDLEIIRDDSTHKQARLVNRDLIKKRRIKQTSLFPASQFATTKKTNPNRLSPQLITAAESLSHNQPTLPGLNLGN